MGLEQLAELPSRQRQRLGFKFVQIALQQQPRQFPGGLPATAHPPADGFGATLEKQIEARIELCGGFSRVVVEHDPQWPLELMQQVNQVLLHVTTGDGRRIEQSAEL